MLLLSEQKTLIEKTVKSNKNFAGNEDLFEDFCSEALQKSYMIFNTTSNIQRIESYVAKVVHTSILRVLKDSGRIRKTAHGYIPTNELTFSSVNTNSLHKLNVIGPEYILDFPDPKESAEEILITKDCLQRIADAVCIIHKEKPSELYMDIFCQRYIEGHKQNEIAESLNISQAEVSKRLLELSKLISNFLDNGKSQV